MDRRDGRGERHGGHAALFQGQLAVRHSRGRRPGPSRRPRLPVAGTIRNNAFFLNAAYKRPRALEVNVKSPAAVKSASASIDKKIKELGDWRGKTLAKVRDIIH